MTEDESSASRRPWILSIAGVLSILLGFLFLALAVRAGLLSQWGLVAVVALLLTAAMAVGGLQLLSRGRSVLLLVVMVPLALAGAIGAVALIRIAPTVSVILLLPLAVVVLTFAGRSSRWSNTRRGSSRVPKPGVKRIGIALFVIGCLFTILSVVQTDFGGCSPLLPCYRLTADDVKYDSGLRLPTGSFIASSYWEQSSWHGYSMQLDMEARTPAIDDEFLVAQHFDVTHRPDADLLAYSDPRWAAAEKRLTHIRYFTNQAVRGENAGTYLLVGRESDGATTLVADLNQDV